MIKEVFDQLNPDQRRLLMYAFNNQMVQVVEVTKDHFLGVNIDPKKSANLIIEETAGAWSAGRILSNSVEVSHASTVS